MKKTKKETLKKRTLVLKVVNILTPTEDASGLVTLIRKQQREEIYTSPVV